ncbi:MAG: multiheme c-type cytochrome [Bacteroidetes bacterium]|nr:multiheme c-type cytochrome [Bacteroidota bacterium]
MMITNHRSWKMAGLVATVVIVLSFPLSLLLNHNQGGSEQPAASFTGGKACIECHQKEYRLWKGSDHDNAMSIASDTSVLGDFNNTSFTFNGKTSKFYKRNGKFYVFTEATGGRMMELQVSHTFGIRPLQQYLVPFGNGRYQCLPIAWNTVEKKWFQMAAMVYKPEDLEPVNWLYWTNQAQNWNSMCAECHSTNLQKNFDITTKSYHTTFNDINVNCEACHGPGSAHIEWARLPELARPVGINAGLLVKTSSITSRQYVESCAPCHARRSSTGPYDHNHPEFLNYAIPQLPVRPAYNIDGQFKDEDYEYGSFTQSKMYMKDVRCGDCHDPHSLKRKFEGNALCTQCHRADEYDTYNHHLHKSKGEAGTSFINKAGQKLGPGDGNLCRDCHMPGRFYMGVDRRYDHSMRIPRPDLSLQLGTPNACTNCHDDKSDQWALQNVNKWYGERKKAHYATILAAAASGTPGADSGLLRIINSNLYPEIIRATAIGYLSGYPGVKAQEVVRRALGDPDPLLRHTAVEDFASSDSAGLMRILVSMLGDPVKSVRMEAANRLSTYPETAFNQIQYPLFLKALDEYKQAQEYVADFPTGRYNLGNFYSKRKDYAKAEENYREAISIDNLFYPAKVNLAILYYKQGKSELAEQLFRDLVLNHSAFTDGYYYLALLYGEQKKYPEAIALLETAVTKPGINPRIWYNLGLLYQMTGQDEKCITTLAKGLQADPCNYDLLYALFAYYMNRNERDKAAPYINKMRSCFPAEKVVQEMYARFLHK